MDYNFKCEWLQSGGGPSRNAGYSVFQGSKPQLKWVNDLKNPLFIEPTIGYGFIFIAVANKGIQLNSIETGDRIVNIKTNGPISAPLSISDSILVYNEYGKKLIAVNWVSQHKLWAVDLYGMEFSPVIYEDMIIWHDGRQAITCFDIKEGKRIWDITAAYGISAPMTMSSEGILIIADNGFIECLSPVDGSVLWRLKYKSRIKTSPVIYGDKFSICTIDGNISQYEMSSGTRIWENQLGISVLASPAADNDGIYICSNKGELIKLNPLDGTVIWSITTAGPVKAGPVIWGNIVVIPSLNRSIFFVDKDDGTVIYIYRASGMLSSRPAICSDRLIVAGEDENLYCFEMLRKDEQGNQTNMHRYSP